MEWLIHNWQWIMLGFYATEKAVRMSPWKWDDLLFDGFVKPVFNMFFDTILKPMREKTKPRVENEKENQ